MFDVSTISTMIMPIIIVLCLCVGYIVKNLIPNDSINRFIPLIVGVVGVVAGVISAITTGAPITLELVVGSLVSGLASCAVYDQFKHLLEDKCE
nr:MAG TPA: holin [Caudoviricetes sp.]